LFLISCGLLAACMAPVRSQTAGKPVPKETATAAQPDYAPKPEDSRLARGKAFVERTEIKADLLTISGNLPTGCHALRIVVPKAPDATGTLPIEVYSVFEPRQICAQMLRPFNVSMPLSADQARARITVNGKAAGLPTQ